MRHGKHPRMLLWFGLCLLVLGVACFAVDRRAAHYFYDRIHIRVHRRIWRTTDFAKGAHWLIASILIYGLCEFAVWTFGPRPMLLFIADVALAFLASLAVGSLILHIAKTLLGRRRPRDEIELKLYGFKPFSFQFQYDSFPSGHALTIFCVAVIACCVFPQLALLWFAIALYLALTRAFLNAHFLSDVFVGSAVGLLSTRETVFYLFPSLFQSWF
jgi:membrane-associated phospholipid phosphatase